MAILTVSDMTRKEQLVAELAADVTHGPQRVPTPRSDPVLAKFNQIGTKLWLDTGNLEEAGKLCRLEMSAPTTNNTLANQVVQTGIMDDAITEAARRIKSVTKGRATTARRTHRHPHASDCGLHP